MNGIECLNTHDNFTMILHGAECLSIHELFSCIERMIEDASTFRGSCIISNTFHSTRLTVEELCMILNIFLVHRQYQE